MAKALRLTQVERKEISDAKMLEAAVDLIVERGTGQATLKDVGEKAGYSRGLAGYRFGNKEGLFDFVLRSVGDEWLALAPESQLKPVILGIHKRRRGDVINWIEQGIERGLLAPSLDTALIADHFTASVSGIVYHWMSDPDNLDEMRTNHNGLKQVMRAMLAAR